MEISFENENNWDLIKDFAMQFIITERIEVQLQLNKKGE
jgi:hypothetical protein